VTLSLIGLAALLFVAFLGYPLGFAMVAVGYLGFGVARGWSPALETVGQIVLDLSMSSEFSSLPLFILMGVFIYHSKISDDLYAAAHAWLGHLRGGLAMATVLACGGLAAVSGSSVATTATMAKVSMIPMQKYGYSNGFAAGTIASGGTLGILIPPSVPLLIYGILANQNIGKLFVAGILPGIVLISLYILAISVVTRIWPEIARAAPGSSWSERWTTTLRIWPVLVLFVLILAGIYLGVFTASEAGGIGATGAFAFAVYRRTLTWENFVGSLVEGGRTTAMLFTVGFGALIMNNFVTIAGMTNDIVTWLQSLQVAPVVVILALVVIYLILGCLFDGMAMILLTVPVFYPIVAALGYDLIWFGIFLVVLVEIGMITPPVGMNVFVMKTLFPNLDLWDIFKGIVPFFFADLVLVGLIIVFPTAVLWLPGFMK
jgi:tripartite ATP-independent transporter DctM subunit